VSGPITDEGPPVAASEPSNQHKEKSSSGKVSETAPTCKPKVACHDESLNPDEDPLGTYTPAEWEEIDREIEAAERATREAIAEPRALPALSFFHTIERTDCLNTTEMRLPAHGGGAEYVAYAVLWDTPERDPRVYSIVKRLWKRRAIWVNCHFFLKNAAGDRLIIGLDAAPEIVSQYEAAIARLQWSLPLPVTVVALAQADVDFAERLGLGVHSRDDGQPVGTLPS
jgi:hypothetical protein